MHRITPSRLLLTLFVTASLLLTACSAPQPHVYKVGIVYASIALEQLVNGLKAGMTEQGYVEGKTVTYIYDKPTSASSNSPEQLAAQVQKLIQAQVDIIVTVGTPATQAAKDATVGTAMPIVFVPIADPVKAGFVKSFQQPGANITGVASPPELQGKRVEYLVQIVPNLKRIYVPYDAVDTSADLYLKITSDAAATLGVELVTQPIKSADEATAAINNIPDNIQAIYLLPSGPLMSNRGQDLINISLQKKLPLSVSNPAQATQGALFAYNFQNESAGKQTARLVVKILNGTKPSDIPVETADSFLTINLKTAQAIDLTIGDDILRQAASIIR